MSEARGVYIHFPFCLSKCAYCDFCSFPGSTEEERDRYIDALCREIHAVHARSGAIETVYFGGGTPSLMTAGQLERVFSALRSVFRLASDAEITLEVNPKTADREKLCDYASLGVNRISLGMQSMIDGELVGLGRAHRVKDLYAAYRDARDAGIGRINLDLMYGIPGQTAQSLAQTLRLALALRPEHISAYGLIIEEGTPFSLCRDQLALPDEDGEYGMYRQICRALGDGGYRHYEISNYALPGETCRHNLIYWHAEEYYAFGLSAASFLGGVRRVNTSVLADYLRDPCRAVTEALPVSGGDAEYEYIMLALRLAEGIGEESFYRRFGHRFSDTYRDRLAPYRRAGYLVSEGGRTHLTEQGLYVSSALLTDLLP